jgi:hypothetical protein
MRMLVVITLAGLFVAGSIAALKPGSETKSERLARPSLRVVDQTPFTVEGRHFPRQEIVRVTLFAQGRKVRSQQVRVKATGSFRVTLREASRDRCTPISIRAAGSRGSLAELNLPRPACQPARQTS